MPHVTRGLRAAVTAAAAATLAVGVLTSTAAAQPSTARAGIAGTHPAWATASARISSQSVTSGTVNARVYLAGQDPAGLASYAMAVSTPGNALYGHYLTPAQVMARYGPTQAQVSAVSSWLTGAGLTVTKVKDEMGGYVEVQGSVLTAAQRVRRDVRDVQGTGRPGRPRARGDGERARGRGQRRADRQRARHGHPRHDPGSVHTRHAAAARPELLGRSPVLALLRPEDRGQGAVRLRGKQPWTNCGYTPRQIRGAYGVSQSGMTGKGLTVAIVDAYASPTMPSDANQYAKVTGDKPFAAGQYTQYLASNFTDTAPASATRQAGTASRRSTSRRYTARRRTRTWSTSARRAAPTRTWSTRWR